MFVCAYTHIWRVYNYRSISAAKRMFTHIANRQMHSHWHSVGWLGGIKSLIKFAQNKSSEHRVDLYWACLLRAHSWETMGGMNKKQVCTWSRNKQQVLEFVFIWIEISRSNTMFSQNKTCSSMYFMIWIMASMCWKL